MRLEAQSQGYTPVLIIALQSFDSFHSGRQSCQPVCLDRIVVPLFWL